MQTEENRWRNTTSAFLRYFDGHHSRRLQQKADNNAPLLSKHLAKLTEHQCSLLNAGTLCYGLLLETS
jgi:hypothetical protein